MNLTPGFAYIWEYRVKDDGISEFRRIYGPRGDWVELSVTDTGHGMTPEVLEQAFEPFFTTKEIGQGSGMGLAVVHGIVTQTGGEILVDSSPEHGTGFRILFPPSEQINGAS